MKLQDGSLGNAAAKLRKEMRMNLSILKALWREEDGQDLVEYSLLLAFIALAAISVLSGAGKSITGLFSSMSTSLGTANSAVTSPS